MQTIFHGAKERGYAKHGWLETHHSFSFASYYDPGKMGFGALRVINDDLIAPGAGFGDHPHDNMEIITIPLSGSLAHHDSLGNGAVIKTGEVQVMSAGTGVLHSEYNASTNEPVTLLQIWIVPNERNVTPRYEQREYVLPENMLTEVVGEYGVAEIGIHQRASLSLGHCTSGQKMDYVLKHAGNGVYFFVIEGTLEIEEQVLSKRDALGVWDTDKVTLHAKSDAFLLVLEVPFTGSGADALY